MTLDKINVNGLKNFIYYLLIFPLNTFAQRASNEDIHGDALSGGSSLFAAIIGLIVFLFVIKTMTENKGFRTGVFLYAGALLSIILVGTIFGKEITIIYLLGMMVFLFLYDKKITDEKNNQSKDHTAEQRNDNPNKDSSASKKSPKICLKTIPKIGQRSIQCTKCGAPQIIDDSPRMVECYLCKNKWLYKKN
jgi:hypothetical protein